jgi:hypothetical protein
LGPIEEQLAPFGMGAVALLVTILGDAERSAQNILAEIGTDMSVFATDKHFASCEPGNAPGKPPIGRQAALRTRPQRLHMASRSAQASRARRDPNEEHLSPKRSTSACAPDRARPRDRRRQALDPDRHLAHAQAPERPTATSAATTTRAATPNAPPDASSPTSSASATPSPSRRQSHSHREGVRFSV